MDRTAWIVVSLCVIGLIAWYIYIGKQMPHPRPSTISASPSVPPPVTTPSPSPSPYFPPSPVPTPTPVQPGPTFPEKIETLRNADVELRLTNRGGGIKEAVLLNQVAEKGERVVLNSVEFAPIGAIIEQPSSPALPEFTVSAESNSTVQFERTTSEQVTIRKTFFFPKS